MTGRTFTHRRVLIAGGSLAGLLAGNALHRRGWDVHIYERATGVFEGRGAGITILPGLVSGFQAAGVNATEESLGVALPARIALDLQGRVVAEHAFHQVMTSWRSLYEALRTQFPADRYHGGATLQSIEQNDDAVTASFADGQRVDADLLIAADGLRSSVRNQFLPDLKPHYPGYIAWRCLVDENDLTAQTHATLFGRYAVCVTPGEQGIGYAVPGPDQSMAAGKRQYNVVWYHPVPEADLARLMTDDNGRHHANGIAPALISASVRQEMAEIAKRTLAPQFAEAIERAKLVFFQPILDLESPRLAFGRVVIIGDAAFVARPHVAMGVPKAASDVLALVQALERGDNKVSSLQSFEAERLRVGAAIVARGKYLGAYMEAQLQPENIRRHAEALRVAEQVMMETAAPMNYN